MKLASVRLHQRGRHLARVWTYGLEVRENRPDIKEADIGRRGRPEAFSRITKRCDRGDSGDCLTWEEWLSR